MSEAIFKSTPGGRVPPFTPEIIDFDTHADGALLRSCCSLVKLWDAHERLEQAIAATEGAIRGLNPTTDDGRIMKRLAVGGVA